MLRFDYRLIAFTATKGTAQRADVLVERRILDRIVAPDGVDDLFTPEQPAAVLAGVLEHVFENRTRLAGEFHFLAVFTVEIAVSEIESERAKDVGFETSEIHEAHRIV